MSNGNGSNVKKELLEDALSWLRIVFSVLLFMLILINFVVVNAVVHHFSMENTLSDGDRIISFRLAYLFREPARYDIVVFDRAMDDVLYIKRVIGTPGDEVRIADGNVYVNNSLTRKDFVSGESFGSFGPVLVPKGHFFVLGDNRSNSIDSRHWPEVFISGGQIHGRAVLRYFPRIRIIFFK